MKKILFGLFLSLIFTSFVFAQNQESNTQDFTSEEPDLYVENIELVNNEYTTGQKINGQFSVFNTGKNTASDVKYQLSLVSVEVEDGLIYPISIINSANPVEIGSMKNGESEIQFSYDIPNTLPKNKNLALNIDVLIGDSVVAKEQSELKIGGNLVDYIFFGNTFLSIDEEFFHTKEGPTVSKGEVIDLNVEMSSPVAISGIVPNIKVFSGINQNGENIENTNLEAVSLTKDEFYMFSVALPTDQKAGVYTAVFSLIKDGKVISEVLESRYIVGGDDLNPKILSVNFNDTDQNAIDKFTVSLSFANVPINHRKDENGKFIDPRAESYYIENISNLSEEELASKSMEDNVILPEGMSAEVSIYDAKTNLIIDKKDIRDLTTITEVDFYPIKKTNEIKVSVDLKKNGEVVDTKEVTTSIVPTKGGWKFLDQIFSNPKIAGVAGFILLVLIIGIMILANYIKKNKKIINPLVIIFASVLVSGSLIIFDKPEEVSAGQTYNINMDVNSPKPPSVRSYEPNELIKFNADFQFLYCGNEWHIVKGQISEPSLRGRDHRAFGPIKQTRSVKLNTAQKEDLIDQVREELKNTTNNKKLKRQRIRTIGNPSNVGRNIWTATYTDTFRAPKAPGIYWFKYRFIVENGQGTGITREGVATFQVEKDLCVNIPGVQGKVPRGYVGATNGNGAPICNIQAQAQLNCSASKTRLQVGETVTYSAQTTSGNRANFSWYEGREVLPSKLVKTQNNVVSSSYQNSYNQFGIYYTTVQSAIGTVSDKCTMVVAVGEDFWDEPLEEVTTEEVVEEDLFYTDDNGNKYPLDNNVPAGKIKFNMDERLTNTTCTGDWIAENVLKCGLYRNNSKVEDNIALSGNKNFNPGIYQIKCIQTKDGKEIVSETRNCRLNPNVREL